MVRILIAADECRISSFLEKGLRANGFAAAIDFEVLTLDLGLPGQGGLEALGAIRRRGDRLPVMVLTPRQDPGPRDRSRGWRR